MHPTRFTNHYSSLVSCEQDDGEETLSLAESGPLQNVVFRNGRAVGTLGHEEEMRKLRRQLIPKKVCGCVVVHKCVCMCVQAVQATHI